MADFGGEAMNVSKVWSLIKETYSSWADDYAQSMGAALAYYTLFSIAPLLLIIISIAGIVFGEEAARGEIYDQLHDLMGQEGAMAVQGLLKSVNKPGKGMVATVVGVAVLLAGASSVFGELQSALNRIWRVPGRDKSEGVWALLRSRLLSLGMMLGLGFLLMASLVLHAALAVLGKWWGAALGEWETLAQIANVVISFAFTTLIFAMIYKLMPRADIHWRDVRIGATITALLFTFGKYLIGLYIGKSGVSSGFGAAGSLVAVLVWLYYSAQIFLLGAEFTWVYARSYGSRKGESETERSASKPPDA